MSYSIAMVSVGTGELEVLASSDYEYEALGQVTWSPDASRLAYMAPRGIYVVGVAGSTTPTPTLVCETAPESSVGTGFSIAFMFSRLNWYPGL